MINSVNLIQFNRRTQTVNILYLSPRKSLNSIRLFYI